MEHIREYLLSVTSAAMICGVIRCFAGERGIISLLCGMLLLLTVIRPMADISINDLTWIDADIRHKADTVVAEGEDYARAAMARRIKEQCEAYILDKAESFGFCISVSFTLNEDLVPSGCIIHGNITSYAKEKLSEILESDMGIPREEQEWFP